MEAVTDPELRAVLLGPHISVPVVVVTNGVITAQNHAARDLLGGEVGRPIESVLDAGSHGKLAAAMVAAPTSCELQSRPGGLEPVTVRVSVVPLGGGEHMLLVGRIGAAYSESLAQRLLAANDRLANLTREASRQAAELEAARARFEALADLREHFVSMLAHDVRGALQGITLSAELIEHGQSSGSTDRVDLALRRMKRSAARILQLVDKVLEAARTESGRTVLDAQPLSLRVVAEDALEVYATLAERRGLQLELVDHAADAIVSGDRIRLVQIAGNLIENAIRHSPAGGVITLELSETPDVVRFVVSDQGPGVPAGLRARLFERFVQGPDAKGSLGLGLYVVREMVELHGGRIDIDDARPHGASFIVELPRVR